MEINIENWSRFTEVSNYATVHQVTVAEAIERLVNSGLSHEPRLYLKP
ncbi:hypothetical protein MINTMi198_17610 [Mycobacterium intracellulare M.i.198]|nr:hypothetical protein [Mycobacterium intracellulare]BCP36391.1 hypothetical protein MINTMi198_17610 [Mycobacterium intracellulare M.i.198]